MRNRGRERRETVLVFRFYQKDWSIWIRKNSKETDETLNRSKATQVAG